MMSVKMFVRNRFVGECLRNSKNLVTVSVTTSTDKNICSRTCNALLRHSVRASTAMRTSFGLFCYKPTPLYQQKLFLSTTGSHYEKWTELSYEDLVALLESHDVQLFDVREPKEIESTGKIDGAVNIPLGEVKEALQLPDVDFYKRFKSSKPQKHDTNIVFYGLGPIKSSAALELAHKAGYKKARHYSGGFEEWSKSVKSWSKPDLSQSSHSHR